MQSNFSPEHLLQSTRSAYLWTRVLNIPFWSILSLLTLILYKEMKINALQIAFFIALKPMSALLASYWSSSVLCKQLKLNIVWANIIRYVPFLFFPWINSPWLIIFAFGIYMIMLRGVVPAWMEIFKRNIKGIAREKVFAFGTIIDYLGPALLPLLIGMLLDDYGHLWRWLFFWTAILGLSSTFFLLKIPPSFKNNFSEPPSFKHQIFKPWREAFALLKEKPDFARYQIGSMLGVSGIIIMISVQTMYFVDVLHLSYTKMALAIALSKGLGVVLTSPLWVKIFRKIDLFSLTSLVTALWALCPMLLISAQYHSFFLYVAFVVYGIGQAGSELSWHMSGPVFSRDGDSSLYSQTNVLAIGLRGCVAPFLGSLMYTFSNSIFVMLAASVLCLLATERFIRYSRTAKELPVVAEG